MSLHNEIRIIQSGIPLTFNQDVKAIVPNDKINCQFLFYVLLAQKENLLGVVEAAGHGTGRLPTDRLLSLPVPDLSIEDQQRLAQVFGALDDKIELNRRMNETLEEMARVIFRDWFVDFGPTRAKMEGREPHLSPDLWALFPDRLDDEGKPEGWMIKSLGQVSDVASGKRPTRHEGRQGNDFRIPLYGGAGPIGYVREPMFETPIIVTGRVGTLGIVHRVRTACWPSDNTLTISPRREDDFEFLYFLLNLMDLKGLNRGSTQPLITQSDLRAQPVIWPSKIIMKRCAELFSTFMARIDAALEENAVLAQTRDLLLPKLMSGEIRVREAEKHLESVA